MRPEYLLLLNSMSFIMYKILNLASKKGTLINANNLANGTVCHEA